MRIKKLHIDGFGIYRDTSFSLSTRSITVFHGQNETGKSTFMEFVRTVLFGFPTRGADQWYPALADGKHGGRLEIVSDADKHFTFERHRGPHGGLLVVTNRSDGREIRDDRIHDALRGHLTRATFRSVLTFDLDDLTALQTSGDSDISSRIYSAGTGARQLEATLKTLGDGQKEIFTKSGRNQKIPKVLSELTELEKKLQVVDGQAAAYQAASHGLDELDAEVQTTNQELRNGRRRHDHWRRFEEAWETWRELQGVEEQLLQYSIQGRFPDEPLNRLFEYEAQIDTQESDVDRARTKLTEVETKVQRPIDGEGLLRQAELCESIHGRQAAYVSSRESLMKRESELAAATAKAEEARKALGPDWDKERVEKFDLPLGALSEIKDWKERLEDLQDERTATTANLSGLERGCQEAEDAFALAQDNAEQNPLSRQTIDDLDNKVSSVKAARRKYLNYDQKRQHLRDLEGQLQDGETDDARSSDRRTLLSGLSVATLAIVLIVLSVTTELSWYVLGGGAVLAGSILWLLMRWLRDRGSSWHAGPTGLVDDARRSVDEAKTAYADELKKVDSRSSDVEGTGEFALDQIEKRLVDAKQSKQELSKAGTLLELRKQRKADCTKQQGLQQNEIGAANIQWSEWLVQNGLPSVLRVDAIGEFCGKIKEARIRLEEVSQLKRRLYGIRKDIEEFVDDVKAVAERNADSLDTSQSDMAIMAKQIDNRLKLVRDDVQNRKSLLGQKPGLSVELTTAEGRLSRSKKKLNEILAAGHATDVEDFRQKARDYIECRDLERTQKRLRADLRVHWKGQHTDDELSEMFRSTTKEAVDSEIDSLNSQLDQLETSRSTQEKEQGRLKEKIDRLSSDERASQLRAEREELREQLRDLAAQWSRLVIAQSLLERAQRKYEVERQPDVVRHATTWFERMSNGRYENIHVGVGGKREISVVDREGRTKAPDQLSRGTRDQLYLALRFGLIQSHGEQDEKIPVVVDEALVNCDPVRASAVVDGFVELSRTNQVLVLTCHPWVVDLFKAASQDLDVVEMASA